MRIFAFILESAIYIIILIAAISEVVVLNAH
jgi:hypothetical protein